MYIYMTQSEYISEYDIFDAVSTIIFIIWKHELDNACESTSKLKSRIYSLKVLCQIARSFSGHYFPLTVVSQNVPQWAIQVNWGWQDILGVVWSTGHKVQVFFKYLRNWKKI